jgi:hypothetical protein
MSGEHDDCDEQEIDEALRAYVAAELDPQLGRARRAFERHVMKPARRPAPRVYARGWVIGVIGTAAAASVAALVWAVPGLMQPRGSRLIDPIIAGVPTSQTSINISAPLVSTAVDWQQTSHEVSSYCIPSDTLIFEGNTPARVVRQVEMERTQWVDERRGVRVEAVVPRERVRLIELDTY